MKVYTKTGDNGQTSLLDGTRVPKDHPYIQALGTIDELTSHLGKIKSQIKEEQVVDELHYIQKRLIIVMGIVAGYDKAEVESIEIDIENIERSIDDYESKSHEFQGFILPGKTPLSADIDIARTVARRAERLLITCKGVEGVVKRYINRLSDYLFMLARYIEENPILNLETLNLEVANQVIEMVIKKAKEKGIKVVVALVKEGGRPISMQAMDEAFVISYELAIKKAFSAVALQMGTHEIAELVKQGADFEGLVSMLDEKIITLGGGYPIKVNGKVIGAIGVSGGSASQDIELAQYGAGLFGRG